MKTNISAIIFANLPFCTLCSKNHRFCRYFRDCCVLQTYYKPELTAACRNAIVMNAKTCLQVPLFFPQLDTPRQFLHIFSQSSGERHPNGDGLIKHLIRTRQHYNLNRNNRTTVSWVVCYGARIGIMIRFHGLYRAGVLASGWGTSEVENICRHVQMAIELNRVKSS